MRDIRNDLQDRASLLEEQINAAEAQFEKLVEQLRTEHESRLEDLKAEFEAVSRLLEVEQRRLANIPIRPRRRQSRNRSRACHCPHSSTRRCTSKCTRNPTPSRTHNKRSHSRICSSPSRTCRKPSRTCISPSRSSRSPISSRAS